MTTRPHWSFWVISGLMLFWNAAGCVNFVVQMFPDMVANYPESERAIIEGRPVWATSGFALAVFGGALGCILLLLRKSAAMTLFILSLIGVVITMAHALSSGISYSVGEIVGIIIMPIAVAMFLIWYAKFSRRKGWIT